jgi:polar amino acid transport system permease protein
MKGQIMKKSISFALALIAYLFFFYYVMVLAVDKISDFSVYAVYWRVIFKGWLTTIMLSGLSLLLSLVVGLILYLMVESKIGFLYFLAEIHKTIIFGTPLLVIAIVAYYYIGDAFHIDSKFWVGVLTLALYIGAYISDIYKGAIEGIHENQWQTAKMFGLTKYQTYRYVVFPQVLKSILPPLAGQFALTIKGSALLSYMATDEFLNTVKTVQSISFRYPEGFIIISIGYWLLTVPLVVVVRIFEKRVNYKEQTWNLK